MANDDGQTFLQESIPFVCPSRVYLLQVHRVAFFSALHHGHGEAANIAMYLYSLRTPYAAAIDINNSARLPIILLISLTKYNIFQPFHPRRRQILCHCDDASWARTAAATTTRTRTRPALVVAASSRSSSINNNSPTTRCTIPAMVQ